MKARILKTEADYQAALAHVESLMDAAPGSAKEEELELWSLLVERYEQKHFPIDLPDPVDAIKFRMEQEGLRQKDLAKVLLPAQTPAHPRRGPHRHAVNSFIQNHQTAIRPLFIRHSSFVIRPMPLAIDFGTSNTVAALWDAGTQDARSLPLADLTTARTDPHGREFHVVPSLMHFHERGQWTGQQVVARDLLATPGTFRWMKSYTGSGMKLPRTLFPDHRPAGHPPRHPPLDPLRP